VTETSSALGDLRKLLLPLAENVTDPFWVKDREGRFVLVNQAALRHLGATSEKDVLGRTDFDFSSDELASQYRADDERVLESGQPLVDKEMLSPDAAGVNHRFSMTKVPTRDTSGTIVGLVGIARDITASRGVETERARLVEEQGALRRVATLVARGVHADELYAAVTQEASRVLHTEAVGMLRLESDESATLVAQSDTPWEPPPLGTRLTLEGDKRIRRGASNRTGRPRRRLGKFQRLRRRDGRCLGRSLHRGHSHRRRGAALGPHDRRDERQRAAAQGHRVPARAVH
jgi:PAS domain S-box-containing protein